MPGFQVLICLLSNPTVKNFSAKDYTKTPKDFIFSSYAGLVLLESWR